MEKCCPEALEKGMAPLVSMVEMILRQLSSCLKLRVPRGRIAILSTYAPHSGYPFDTRQAFFEDLGDVLLHTSVNGSKLFKF